MDGELLGRAVLELSTDQKGLDAGLARAERRVALSTQTMQGIVDRQAAQMGGSYRQAGRQIETQLAAPLARTEQAATRAGQGVQGAMRVSARSSAEAAVKLQGYQLAVASAEQRVGKLSSAVKAGKGDQQALAGALQLAQGRLSLAQGRLETYTAKTVHGARETRSLAAATGVSSRAFSDLTSRMGPVGRTLDDLTTRTRLYRTHGVDYLAAGMLGLEAAIIGLSVRGALRFEELGVTVARQTGLSGRALDELMATIRKVGRDSPYQLTQVSDAAVILRKEFHETDPQIAQSADLMIAFAKAAGSDVRPEMQQLARIMTQFRAPLSNVVGLTDKLVAASQATQQPVSAMVNVLDKFGPKLSALGFGLNDSVRLLAIFQASGIKTEQMGRGLASALTNVTKAQAENQKLLATGPAKLAAYGSAVQSAQLRVDTLSAHLASGKGNQKLLNEQMTIAQGKLTAAKSKYDLLNTSLATAKKAHGDIASSIHDEIQQIVNAHSKQDALNLAMQFFGKNLGPAMARAFYNNRDALAKVDAALGKAGATQRLFNVDAKSMPGRLQEAKNAFQDLEIEIGSKVIPALSDAVKFGGGVIRWADDFYKHHKDLVEVAGTIAGIGSSILLISRHVSPVGNLLGKLAAGAGHTSLANLLTGGKGQTFGIHGPGAAGSLANPMAVYTVNGGGGPGGTPGGGVPGGAKVETSKFARFTRGVLKLTMVAAVEYAVLDTMNILPKIPGPQRPTVRPTASNPRGIPAAGLQNDTLSGRFHTPSSASNPTGFRLGQPATIHYLPGNDPQHQTRAWLEHDRAVRQVNSDYDKMAAALTRLAGKRGDVRMTADALDALAKKAAKAGDTKFAMADRLGAELLRSRNVASRGVTDLVKQLDKLSPGARLAASDAMLDMTRTLQNQGKLPLGSVAKMVATMLKNYSGLRDKGHVYFNGLMKDTGATMEQLRFKIATSTGQQRADAIKAYHALQAQSSATFALMMKDTESKWRSMAGSVAKGSSSMARSAGQNLSDLERSVFTAMKAGVMSAASGSTKISQALNAMLASFRAAQVPLPGLVKVLLASEPSSMPVFQGGGHGGTFQRGGLVQFGRPGARGPDRIPVNFGGSPVVVGSGEVGAVLTGDQQAELNARTADVGGLGGFFKRFSRPHSQTGRGRVHGRGFGTGGLGSPGSRSGGTVILDPGVDMAVGQEPQILADLRGLSAETGQVVYVISGYRSPSHSVSVGGFSNDPHTRGQAADIGLGSPSRSSMLGVTDAQLRAVGLWRPFYPASAAEVNHVQLLGSGASGATGASGAMISFTPPSMKAPAVGGKGTVRDMIAAGLKIEAAGANKYIAKHFLPTGGGGSNTANEALAHRMMLAAGWPDSQWPSLQALWTQESGFSSTATNSSSGAYGIPQSLPASKMASAGADWRTNPATQIKWGLSYIRARYGSPSGAEAHERASNWYERGGLVPRFAQGGNVWRVRASAEDASSGSGWTELSTNGNAAARSGHPHTASHTGGWDFATLGQHYPRGTQLRITNPANRRTGTFPETDVGDGSSFAPAIGLTPAVQSYLGLGGGDFNVDIQFPHGNINLASGFGRLISASSSGGAKAHPSKASLAKAKAARRKPARKIALPRLGTVANFSPALMAQLSALDAHIGDLGTWQGYITALHGSGPQLEPLVTIPGAVAADGSQAPDTQQVNWDGMIDPSSGLFVKGINQRLAEIGDPGAHPNATATRNKDTELGIEEQILDSYIAEQALAGSIVGQLAPFLDRTQAGKDLDTSQLAWLNQSLNLSLPMAKAEADFQGLGSAVVGSRWQSAWGDWWRGGKKGHPVDIKRPFSKIILDKVREYRNAQATIARWTDLKGALTQQRTDRDAAITRRFGRLKHDLSLRSATASFTGGELLAKQIHALEQEKQHDLAGVPGSPPHGWKGDRTAWAAQHKRERSDIEAEYGARAQALRDQAGKSNLGARLSRSNALFALSQEESTDKAAVASNITQRRGDLQALITGRRGEYATDKKWLETLRTAIKTHRQGAQASLDDANGPDVKGTLDAAVNPMGQLAVSLLTAQNIDIPALLTEYAALKGTTAPPVTPTPGAGSGGGDSGGAGGGPDNSALIALLQQQLATAGQELAVSQAQYAVLGSLPFAGSFEHGGVVPGRLGQPMAAIVHGGEEYLGSGEHAQGKHVRVIVEDHRNRVYVDGIEQTVETINRTTARKVGRRLPSQGGGELWPGR